ncbi:MAG: hypothetical protein J5859_03695 [Clostridia bacterium]|nr:hypothetical protein [Clostridia bacterium]
MRWGEKRARLSRRKLAELSEGAAYWAPPGEIALPEGLNACDPEEAAGFLLQGEVFRLCGEGACLTDYHMAVLNKDVHCRMYSLLKEWDNGHHGG